GEAGMENEPFDARHAGKRIRNLAEPGLLRSVLRRIADPSDGYFMWVRCQTTCRSVWFGYDAQAFLCLRHEDARPQSSSLMRVEDCSHRLIETDFLDG